jgi:hypothetical protein
MTHFPAHTASRIFHRAKGILHLIAADEGCEYDDIVGLLSTTRIPNVSGPDRAETGDLVTTPNSPSQPVTQAPAARTYPPAPVVVQAEAAPQSPPTPMPETAPPSRQAETLQGEGGTALSENTVHQPAVDVAATRPARGAVKARVKALHDEHPEFTAAQAAEHLSMSKGSLEGTSHYLGIKWTPAKRTTWPKKAEAKPVEAAADDLATEPPPEPEALPPVSPEPAVEADEADQPPATTAPYRMAPKIAKRAPQGRFYLRDQDGRYVHQSLQPSPTGPGPLMTSDRKWGWFDTMDRYRGAKKVWPQLSFMRKDAVHA